ncbi:FAD-dependent monooxygenase [Prochlorococcus sp. MIT 1341]|uniref:FAD-dependent monooxygenase n=1 Tax=Prochlorococcus sp. MIT 1341 TaxID=3096221 RepID=UPI002A765287|nr:FAD-dependent monooxygenase [Prochlorococcus sp. MIT 1341]
MNVKVIGAGPTGSLLSLALSRIGSSVSLYDSSKRDALIKRNRAYALTHSSRRILEQIGIWDSLTPYLHPFSSLQLEDHGLLRNADFELNDLSLANKNFGAIGWIVDHQQLMELFFSIIADNPNINLVCGSSSSPILEDHDLVIAADGPNSSCRRSWGIPLLRIPYIQGCLVVKVVIRGGDQNKAHEILRPEGPLALLPMGGEIFQVVWSAPFALCKVRSELPAAIFLDKLACVLPYGFEPDILLDSPAAFPIQFSMALGLGSRNRFLVGESAHRFHPVGGQGLNLCWRDVHTFTELIESYNNGKIRRSSILGKYSRARLFDVLSVGLLTDLLVRIYSSRNFAAKVFRLFVIITLNRVALIRRLLLHFMTDGLTKRVKVL